MPARLARLRVTLTLVNACCAAVTLVVGSAIVVELRRTAPACPATPATARLPAARSPVFEEPEARARELDAPAPVARTTRADDARILQDALSDFTNRYRVILASTDGEPASRTCIVAPRHGGEQLGLSPGDRLGGYLLVAIEPRGGAPRSVELVFRELRRGEDVSVVLRAGP